MLERMIGERGRLQNAFRDLTALDKFRHGCRIRLMAFDAIAVEDRLNFALESNPRVGP